MSHQGPVIADLDEPRLGTEDGHVARLSTLVTPVARALGFRLVRIRLTGERGKTLQIMAERPDGGFAIKDCEALSRALSPLLDVEDILSGPFHLEVSSPGIDRPLARRSDFQRWQGFEAKVELTQMHQNRKKLRGVITHVTGEGFGIKLADVEDPIDVPFALLSEARLVLNDHLLAEAQKRAVHGPGEAGDGATIDDEMTDIELKEDRRKTHGR